MSENVTVQYEKQTVTVTRNGTQLTITPQEFDLKDGTWVEWEIKDEDLQPGEFLFISFAPPAPRLGPFYSLRSFNAKRFLGKGHKKITAGDPTGGSYGYRALILDPAKSTQVASGVGMIRDRATQENTASEIHVTYSEVKDAQGQIIDRLLQVTPNPVGLNTGDTATWLFKELPANTFAFFRFTDPSGLNPETGPFLAFNANTGGQEITVRASAMGFNGGDSTELRYRIELRDWEGNFLASHDPVIDNLGPPPDSDREGEG